MKYLKLLFNVVPKGVSFVWGYVSKYITPSLIVLCVLLGYLLYGSWTDNAELKLKVDSNKTIVEQYETRVDQLQQEIESLKLYIKEKRDATKQLSKDRESLEDRWEQIAPVEEETLNEVQESNQQSGGSRDNPIDLSEHFRLLDEAYCLTTPAC